MLPPDPDGLLGVPPGTVTPEPAEHASGRGPDGPRPRDDERQAQLPPVPLEATEPQGSLKTLLSTPPKANTTTMISAAMPAISRPYSTADAPRSSILALCALSMMCT